MTEKMRELAESVGVLFMARAMALFGVPVAIMLLAYGADKVSTAAEDLVEIRTALMLGIEPRVKRLEEDLVDVRADLKDRTSDRFSKTDGEAIDSRIERLDARIQRDLLRIEESVKAMRERHAPE